MGLSQSSIGSWVYVYAQFTQQALLFQALGIFLLSTFYAAFWVLKKRKMGSAQSEIPSGVVKVYLTELIDEAEMLRAQLFGLLRTSGGKIEPSAHAAIAPVVMMPSNGGSNDHLLLEKISILESKMSEQARAMEALAAEKRRIEADLAAARTASASGAIKGGDPIVMNQLQEKISNLEGKLAEYSVIEDELANLKRLQQENTQLKTALEGKGGSVTPLRANAVSAIAQSDNAGGVFDQLVDQVEQSLEPTAEAVAEPAIAELSTSSRPPDSMEKSDADLVAEFEKMLRP